jgi:hypothetical protein
MHTYKVINPHKIFAIDVIEFPRFQLYIRQFLVDKISDVQQDNENNSTVILALNKDETDFLWEQLFKLKMGEEISPTNDGDLQ